MALIQWRKALSVGVPELDADHRKLIRYFNELQEARQAGGDFKASARVMINLVRYTDAHFRREEKAMVAVSYPDFNDHKKEHDAGRLQVLRMAQGFVENPRGGVDDRMMDFLSDWLTDHIIESDRPIGEYFAGRRVWQLERA